MRDEGGLDYRRPYVPSHTERVVNGSHASPLAAIALERAHQRTTWGSSHDDAHTPLEFAGIASMVLGELALRLDALPRVDGLEEDDVKVVIEEARAAATDVAATAFAIMDYLDRKLGRVNLTIDRSLLLHLGAVLDPPPF